MMKTIRVANAVLKARSECLFINHKLGVFAVCCLVLATSVTFSMDCLQFKEML